MTTLEKFIADLQVELKKTLSPLDLQDGELASLGSAITSVRQQLFKLREFVSTYRFSDISEEIRFFKETKPVVMSQYIYHKEVFDIRLRCSMMQWDEKQRRIQHALRRCRSYTTRHQEFYRYCLSNATHLDEQYFTRSAHRQRNVDADPSFTTANDPILSRLVSMQLLSEFLNHWINNPEREPASNPSRLKWTASKTDLTELIYALQESEVFNNGAADIKQIATAFESMTGTILGDYYRIFHSIQVRKINRLAFLERLKDRLQERLDDIQ